MERDKARKKLEGMDKASKNRVMGGRGKDILGK